MPRTHFLGQPRAFYLIFFIEIWERFGYYGVQALLVLFMVQFLKLPDGHADTLFTSFSALAFLYPALGGYVGDNVIGTKRTILLGAITLSIGYLLLSLPLIPGQYIEFPLAIVAVGNGLFKANPSSLLSKIYEKDPVNQDSGFTLYYMAINLGGFISMALVPLLNKFFGWHVGFSVCFAGLIIAILNYFLMKKMIDHVGSDPDFRPIRWKKYILVIFCALLLIGASYWLLDHNEILTYLLVAAGVVLLLMFLVQTFKAHHSEKKGMFLFVVLFLQAILFFVMYFQMPTSINLFVLRNVAYGAIPPASFQSLNPIWILIMSPVLAVVYNKLQKRGSDLSLPTKFSLGTLLAGTAFLILPLAAYFSRDTGIVSPWWVVTSYWFQSTGELLVSALGLSLASRFVPQRFMGYSMGLWFLSMSLASLIAGHLASLASIPQNVSHDPKVSLPIYSNLFLHIGIVTVVFAVVMFCLIPLIKRLIVKPATR